MRESIGYVFQPKWKQKKIAKAICEEAAQAMKQNSKNWRSYGKG